MLSPKTQTNLHNAESYFDEHLAIGDYYSETGQRAGTWLGKGAQMLGLSGIVQKSDFIALCKNLNPNTGDTLTQRTKHVEDNRRRVFFDFTFSPPKSVSLAALVNGDERIAEAHAHAVHYAVNELERFAAARIRAAGSNHDRTTANIICALFQHDTSRALDPHLHTHCIVFNATHEPHESKWKALQNHGMLSAQKYVEAVYYHELSKSLVRLGYGIENHARGDFQLAGIRKELCERFSKRHLQINDLTKRFLEEHPDAKSVMDVREHIAHQSRAKKTATVSREHLHRHWLAQMNAEEIESLKLKTAPSLQDVCSVTSALALAEQHLFERKSVVHEHELLRYALQFARPAHFTLAELKTEISTRNYIRNESGKMTRHDVLARERAIISFARKSGLSALTPQVLFRDDRLEGEQLRAFERILSSRHFVTLFRGGAGTGKSFVLRRVQKALDRAGMQTIVLAPQRQQVIDLTRDGLDNANTVAHFLQQPELPPRAVLIIDEAGQISASQMHELLRIAYAANARVVLSGDTRQHGPVECSDALRAIEKYCEIPCADLAQIRRQDPARAASAEEQMQISQYREAVKAAADGDFAASFAQLEQLGAIHETVLIHTAVADACVRAAQRNESTLVVSQTWNKIDALNENIRTALRRAGLLQGNETNLTTLRAIDLTTAQKQDRRYFPAEHALVFHRNIAHCKRGDIARCLAHTQHGIVIENRGRLALIKDFTSFSVCKPIPLTLCSGDRIQLKANARNSRGQQFANGEVVEIAHIKPNGEILLRDQRTLPADYRQFVRGHAVTSYASQGKTVDHVILVDCGTAAATNTQQWYVSISRGRKSVRIFTRNKTALQQHITKPGDRELALSLQPATVKQPTPIQQIANQIRQTAHRFIRVSM
jgi:conjugative relaxase-like TrwC/TraI family protein